MKALLAVLALALAGCSPAQAIALTFGNQAVGGSGRLAAEANQVAWCESEHTPTAVSPTNDHGLFQINAVHQRSFTAVTGQPWSAVYEPLWNAVYAKHLHDRLGWQPWTCTP